MCSKLADSEPACAESAGIKVPASKKDLMLLMRRSDDADGESRMIGSGRRPGLLGSVVFVGGTFAAGAPGRFLDFPKKASAVFLT